MALRGLAPNSVSTYERCARQFLAHVDQPLAAVKRTDIERYLHTLVDKARSPRTRNVQQRRLFLEAPAEDDPMTYEPTAVVAADGRKHFPLYFASDPAFSAVGCLGSVSAGHLPLWRIV
jgi:hypothetical protein